MSSNPRRTPMTRPDPAVLALKTNMILRKGATFHSPTTPMSPEIRCFKPPSLPRRSQTSLDDVIDSHRRRAALALGSFEKSLATSTNPCPFSSLETFRDESLPVPRGILHHTVDSSIMSKEREVQGRVLRSRSRRPSRHADSALGTSIVTSVEKAPNTSLKSQKSVKASALTRSAAAGSTASASLPSLSERATNRIVEHVLKPLLAKPAFKDFHPLILECPRKIKENEIVCLRDVEKTLLLLAPERTHTPKLYLDFSLTTVRCIQATVSYLNEREQTRPRDLPYTSGYFVDLVDQIRQYATQLAEVKAKGNEVDEMDLDRTDEIKLHGGLRVNGRQPELVRINKNGQAFSLATGQPVDFVEEEVKDPVRIKRSMSEQLEDDESIMRSMARRKKNATPEELAPKKCREPGCNKEFKRPCDLTKHEKTHSRPWKCPVVTCKYHDYGWPTEKEMDRHHNDKHSAAPPMYHCYYKPCPYKSKRQSNCKQHMEKAHGWTYVRTKTNGKKSASISGGSVAHATPPLHSLPTPEYSIGVATPPNDPTATFPGLDFSNDTLNSLDFPDYNHNPLGLTFDGIPQHLQLDPLDPLDFSPIDNATPSTDSGADRNSAYQDIGNDFTLEEDIYAAPVQIASSFMNANNLYSKDFVQQFVSFTPEMPQPPAAAHLSPTGQGNAMLFTPTSMAGVDDEGFVDDHQDYNGMNGSDDFILYDDNSLQKPSLFSNSLFSSAEVPSLTAGYSQPHSQDILDTCQIMEWSMDDNFAFMS